ncbi:MAG: polymerase LigD, ligase domain protein [Pseudonocardiales bacterium]|nr:polymerase LigD, ligase domain protein [Pseudonocardiales bacterium]
MQPMLALTAGLPTGPEWSYEFKWDGMRALVDATPGALTVTSRNGNNIATAYPELTALFGADGTPDVLLDGEIVAFDGDGRPSFGLLQTRMHVRAAKQARALAASTPVSFLIFDVLRLHGVDLLNRSYTERRATLERVAADHPGWVVSPAFDDGEATSAAAQANGLEGVVAKRRTSPYRPGARNGDWVKVKFLRRQEFAVLGWEAGDGNRAGTIGSLMLGVSDAADPSGWTYMGQVGSGLSAQSTRQLESALSPLARPDPVLSTVPVLVGRRAVTWVEPRVVVEVEYSGLSTEGRLRHPVFLGIRTDKAAIDAVWEGTVESG